MGGPASLNCFGVSRLCAVFKGLRVSRLRPRFPKFVWRIEGFASSPITSAFRLCIFFASLIFASLIFAPVLLWASFPPSGLRWCIFFIFLLNKKNCCFVGNRFKFENLGQQWLWRQIKKFGFFSSTICVVFTLLKSSCWFVKINKIPVTLRWK